MFWDDAFKKKLVISWQDHQRPDKPPPLMEPLRLYNVFCGKRIYPGDETAMENLARYSIRASFSQERMTYLRDESKVVYQGKDAKKTKTFDALEWLAAIPARRSFAKAGVPMCQTGEN